MLSSDQAPNNPTRPQDLRTVLRKTFLQFFLGAPSASFNLAVFRIVFFYFLAHYGNFDMAALVDFSRTLLIPPPGYEHLTQYIPINLGLAVTLKNLFVLACISACLGFRTRTSAGIVFFSGLYVLGLPCFFGKINHYQHLLWFPSILAVSHSGDALSVDALIRTFSRVRRPITVPAEESPDAAAALKCIGILLGLIYFFPGYWKIRDCGLEWIFSDNLKYFMRRMWYLYDYVPPLRPDLYPFLYKGGALAAIIFELSAVFAAMVPAFFVPLAISGVLFHILTNLFLSINFESLMICYVVFINWARIPEWICKKKSFNIPAPKPGPPRRKPAYAVLFVSAVWIAGALWCGPRKLATWPVGVYPLFNYLTGPEVEVVTVGFEDAQGRVEYRNFKQVYPHFSTPNRWLLELKILGVQTNTAPLMKVCEDLARTALLDFPQLTQSAAAIHFYRDRVRLDPDLKYDLVPGRTLIVNIPLAPLRGDQNAGGRSRKTPVSSN